MRGKGLAVLWPLSAHRFHSPWRVFPDAPRGMKLLSRYGMAELAIEFGLFLPVTLYALWPRIIAWVRRESAPRLRVIAGDVPPGDDAPAAATDGRRCGPTASDNRRGTQLCESPDRGRSVNLPGMFLRKERAAVRNATRAIRDLVLRPGRDLAAGGLGGGFSGGLNALSLLASGPLRHMPEMAARLPGALRIWAIA